MELEEPAILIHPSRQNVEEIGKFASCGQTILPGAAFSEQWSTSETVIVGI